MIPSVTITKSDGNTGVVKPGAEGILAIIAPAEKGAKNQAATYTRPDLALADFGYGPLAEFGAYVMSIARNPVLLIRPEASTAGAYGPILIQNPGTSGVVPGDSRPFDDYEVRVEFPVGGTVGTAGIQYIESLDGGRTKSARKALGTGRAIFIPGSGVSFAFDNGATFLTGESFTCRTTGPRASNTDLVAALEALRVTGSPWDAVLVHGEADAATIAILDLWLSAREGEGQYHTAIVNTWMRPPGESEATYKAALQAAYASAASIRVLVGADGGDVVSPLRGTTTRRPTALALAARGMSIDFSTDAALVSDGPVDGFQITDARDNPKYHDEALFPGLDDLRFATLRSLHGRDGTFITNPLLFSATGSDYVYWQHARSMNRGCDIAYQLLTGRLSQGVQKDLKTGHIAEHEAQELEGLVQAELDRQLVTPRRVSGAAFILSRTDDLSSNAGATITGDVQVSALAYIKKFAVIAKFVRRITVSAT